MKTILTDDEIAELRKDGPPMAQACPHWSRWEILTLASGKPVIMFRCDNPEAKMGSLGDLPIAETCQVAWGSVLTLLTPSVLAQRVPTIGFVYLNDPPPRHGYVLISLRPAALGSDPEGLWQEARRRLLEIEDISSTDNV